MLRVWKYERRKETMSLSPNHWTHSYMIFSCRLSVEPFVPWTFCIANLRVVIMKSYHCLTLQFLKIFLMSKLPPSWVQELKIQRVKKGQENTHIYIVSKPIEEHKQFVHEICTLKGIKKWVDTVVSRTLAEEMLNPLPSSFK